MSSRLPKAEGTTLHHQISAVLRAAITSSVYPVGSALPSESRLMEEYGVSRATVRRAMLTLQSEGLVESRQGKGTRVTWRDPGPSPIADYLRIIELKARETEVAVLDHRTMPAPPQVAAVLDIAPGTPVLRIARLRTQGGIPIRYVVNYCPVGDGYPEIDPAALSSSTMTAELARHGFEVFSAEDEIGATLADPAVAATLGVATGSPLIDLRRVMRAASGPPLTCQYTLIPAELGRVPVTIATRTPAAPGEDRTG